MTEHNSESPWESARERKAKLQIELFEQVAKTRKLFKSHQEDIDAITKILYKENQIQNSIEALTYDEDIILQKKKEAEKKYEELLKKSKTEGLDDELDIIMNEIVQSYMEMSRTGMKISKYYEDLDNMKPEIATAMAQFHESEVVSNMNLEKAKNIKKEIDQLG